jgi:hypothetical protein
MTHMLIALGIIWLATACCVFGLGFEAHRWRADRSERRAIPYRLSLEGYRATLPPSRYQPGEHYMFSGQADPGQFEIPREPRIDRLALLADAADIATREMTAAEAHREAEQIWLEVQGNPDLWRYRP